MSFDLTAALGMIVLLFSCFILVPAALSHAGTRPGDAEALQEQRKQQLEAAEARGDLSEAAALRYAQACESFDRLSKVSNFVKAGHGGSLSAPKWVWRGDHALMATAMQELEWVAAHSPKHYAKARRKQSEIAKMIGESRQVAASIARGDLAPADDFDAEAYLRELNGAFPESADHSARSHS